MENFNILDRNQKIYSSYLLEASAGTGKTFAIENLFARLLLDAKPLHIDEMLIVTFTQAAAKDLKMRIRNNLETILHTINQPSEEMPDYLMAIKEKDGLAEAQIKIQEALIRIEEAQISTIHGFCYQVLHDYAFEAGISLQENEEELFLSDENLLEVIDLFFKTRLKESFITGSELEIAIKRHLGVENLKHSLLNTVKKGIQIDSRADLENSFIFFKEEIDSLKERGWKKDLIVADLLALAPNYKGVCDRQGNVKQEYLNKIDRLSALFDRLETSSSDLDAQIKDQLFKVFTPSQLKSQVKKVSLHNPEIIAQFKNKLWPIIEEASGYLNIYSKLAAACQKAVFQYLKVNEKLEFSYLLRKTFEIITHNLKFKEKISDQFKAVIIDEFQDTDPLQWKIFEKLFLNSKTYLYLVGDPKQSIYSFRSADIYTYFSAEKALLAECKAALNTNFRSEQKLVLALNCLFDEQKTPGWLFLPRLNETLRYPPVSFSNKIAPFPFKDALGSIHFCIAQKEDTSLEHLEDRIFFPYYAEEIQRLNVLEGVPLKDIAILVSDRFQMKRLATFLKKKNIKVAIQRAENLKESGLPQVLGELLAAVLNPKNESLLKIALGGKLIAYSLMELSLLEDPFIHAKTIEKMLSFKKIWLQKGFGCFFEAFLDSVWKDFTIREEILRVSEGEFFFGKLYQVATLLIEYEMKTAATPEKLLNYLRELEEWSEEDEDLKVVQDMTKDAVNMMTLFASKGLEFGIVFVHALLKRSKVKEELALVKEKEELKLSALKIGSVNYELWLEEIDAEKMRQLYVALTRAKHRVYIAAQDGQKPPKKGTAAPIELFLARLGHPSCALNELYQRLESSVINNLETLDSDGLITKSFLKECNSSFSLHKEEIDEVLIPPKEFLISVKPLFSHSFSSLQFVANLETSPNAPHDFEASLKNAHTLPAGKETGILLHLLLQNFNFNEELNLKAHIRPFTKNTPFEKWESILFEIIKNALFAPLGNEKIRLAGLKPFQLFKEMEFLCSADLIKLPFEYHEKGFLNGVIDLAFTANRKYYLIDWKSNWLGEDSSYYSKEHLELAMKQHDYFLQARIYKAAFEQYMTLFEDRPFKDYFGGFFYIFLRGLDAFFPERGVYHFFMDEL